MKNELLFSMKVHSDPNFINLWNVHSPTPPAHPLSPYPKFIYLLNVLAYKYWTEFYVKL